MTKDHLSRDRNLTDKKSEQASNMNFGLMISCKVEEKLKQQARSEDWTSEDEAKAYERCLKEALEEDGRAWADGNIRVGDYILLSMIVHTYNEHN